MRVPQLLPETEFNFANYKWAYGILDSRSIWWNGERHLVPMLDLINCAEGPDKDRVHSTVLDDSVRAARAAVPATPTLPCSRVDAG